MDTLGKTEKFDEFHLLGRLKAVGSSVLWPQQSIVVTKVHQSPRDAFWFVKIWPHWYEGVHCGNLHHLGCEVSEGV